MIDAKDEDDDEIKPAIAIVEFGIGGDDVTPAELTLATNLIPSRAWRKGDRYESKSGRTMARPYGLWVITSKGTNVEACARDLLARVEPHMATITAMSQQMGASLSIGIWWEFNHGQGGFTISSSVASRLASLSERIDLYLPG